ERFASRIAMRIAVARKARAITKTLALVRIIESAVGRPRGRIHPATRTFQALRIRVNDELENIRNGLRGAARALRPGGIIIAISFHSLEDRIVKDFFREMAQQGNAEIITKKPITAAREETDQNPRARSAKLRALRMNS
ncbi:MAG: 16S rRNA (cytosine(1402)-N(4))-methyltransferase, partial [Patescibacteria group bacterium]